MVSGGAAALLYQSDEVDKQVMGDLYRRARQVNPTGDRIPYYPNVDFRAEPGVDLGPVEGAPSYAADGIPAQWLMPSTPLLAGLDTPPGDRYDLASGGGVTGTANFDMPFVPDHDALVN
jgi:hypothetical protein